MRNLPWRHILTRSAFVPPLEGHRLGSRESLRPSSLSQANLDLIAPSECLLHGSHSLAFKEYTMKAHVSATRNINTTHVMFVSASMNPPVFLRTCPPSSPGHIGLVSHCVLRVAPPMHSARRPMMRCRYYISVSCLLIASYSQFKFTFVHSGLGAGSRRSYTRIPPYFCIWLEARSWAVMAGGIAAFVMFARPSGWTLANRDGSAL